MNTCIHLFDMNKPFLGDAFSLEPYIFVVMTLHNRANNFKTGGSKYYIHHKRDPCAI